MGRLTLEKGHINDVIKSGRQVIGFWGAPPLDAFLQASIKYPGLPFFDLDVYYEAPATKKLPDAYCHIMRNCVDNAMALKEQMLSLIAATGEEKCDAGRYAAYLLKEEGIKDVVFTVNHNTIQIARPFLCEAEGPLKARAIRIMESIVEPLSQKEIKKAKDARCIPVAGFWGTPPHPIEVLDLFPDKTHIFGWTKCVETGTPALFKLEKEVPDNLPIVFFSQGFCAKAMIAKELATKYRGMYVDTHDSLNAATMAKIEAFIRLSSRS